MICKIKTISAISAVIIALVVLQSCDRPDTEIEEAVRSQLQQYPESSLQDIYKSFFQDEFGPGHMLSDTSGAWQYFEYELSGMTTSGNYAADPCGAGKNFYRVPLDLVKDGIISDSSLFNAFMESASSFKLPDIESWKKKWDEILSTIERTNLNLPGFAEDKQALEEMLSRGETAVHHSRKYEELYKPHYRIVGKEQWERLSSKFKVQSSKFKD
jgi:hypothetical protein